MQSECTYQVAVVADTQVYLCPGPPRQLVFYILPDLFFYIIFIFLNLLLFLVFLIVLLVLPKSWNRSAKTCYSVQGLDCFWIVPTELTKTFNL